MATTTVDTLNSLLRGEISATETYQQALAKVGNEPGAVDLRRLHAEHRDAANTLRKHVHIFDDKPDQGSGAWGAFTKTVEGVAKLFGNKTALKALKEGEEHGLHAYENALDDPDVSEFVKALISHKLLPQTREHIAALDRMMQ